MNIFKDILTEVAQNHLSIYLEKTGNCGLVSLITKLDVIK
jgi:hypothetical protein